ncbi:DUF262 domain-containing protein [Oryzihumus leptocrescens]|uniref:Uncharacterized protein DUF262 n=1 Tax=Oryzihumus leptocrescens TaxID=297536 RepID=A0A542ZKU4_9MICO|nr:DUF262 domain-containing protein [Oryzihumus leptocrescens]TQL60971.1 uncharacterized protein DUF262 [Oryzihumus leptocrescens]
MTATTLAGGALEPRLVGKIGGKFYVPSYQRGYRWGEHEVKCLLDDIAASDGQPYYLQPVVVKKIDDGRWELVDGQQRLTTLYLILGYIRKHLPAARREYTLEYQTRAGSAAYLEDPVEQLRGQNIDFFHIYEAAELIRTWFESQDDPAMAAVNFYKALSEKVHVIWYEAPDDVDARTLFVRLNVGRIPLTDAELVKALLLSRARRPEEVAAQWDSIERDLRVPEVWSFVTGRTGEEPTHISLLLDTLAGGPRGRERPLFYTFDRIRELIEQTSPEDVWESVVDLHSLVQGWYDDRGLFHWIGYLVATGSRFEDLVVQADGKAKDVFNVELRAMITDRLGLTETALRDLTYEQHYRQASRALLLMNVETVRSWEHSHERYSFRAHAAGSWSLEHIDAQSAETLNKAEQWSTWLQLHKAALVALPDLDPEQRAALLSRIDHAATELTAHAFHAAEEEVISFFKRATGADGDEVHSVSNLALLGREANSALSNSVFAAKRTAILQLDRTGHYIPACTRNVFLKYYTASDAQQIHFWGPQDRASYLEAMVHVLADYLTPEGAQHE